MDFDLSGEEATPEVIRCATLAAQLPRTSRVLVATDERAAWDEKAHLLRIIEHSIRVLLWGMADPKRRGDFPQPIEAPGEAERRQQETERTEAVADIVAAAFNL